jgi:hypothetical protein
VRNSSKALRRAAQPETESAAEDNESQQRGAIGFRQWTCADGCTHSGALFGIDGKPGKVNALITIQKMGRQKTMEATSRSCTVMHSGDCWTSLSGSPLGRLMRPTVRPLPWHFGTSYESVEPYFLSRYFLAQFRKIQEIILITPKYPEATGTPPIMFLSHI